ncbi:MAG: hypothetical protein KDK37_05885 [Leptospiraceae bacterium]|nr:hypothetical protein [Leptospiraceae bacterium]
MKKTDSERAVALIQNSLDRDFVEGFRKRDHGFDAFQITSAFQMRLAAQIDAEQREQELVYLTEVIEVLTETLAEAEIRKAEIDSGRGSLVLFNRQRELAEAHKNAQKRIGMAG